MILDSVQFWRILSVHKWNWTCNHKCLLYGTCDLLVRRNVSSYQRENILIMGKQSLTVTSSVLRLPFYIHHKYFLQSLNLWPTPSLVCSNTLPLSRALSLSLRYLALFPHSSDEYLTLCVQHSWSLNKCISQRVVLISKGCSYTKLSYHDIILLVVYIYHCDLWCRSQWNNAL